MELHLNEELLAHIGDFFKWSCMVYFEFNELITVDLDSRQNISMKYA